VTDAHKSPELSRTEASTTIDPRGRDRHLDWDPEARSAPSWEQIRQRAIIETESDDARSPRLLIAAHMCKNRGR